MYFSGENEATAADTEGKKLGTLQWVSVASSQWRIILRITHINKAENGRPDTTYTITLKETEKYSSSAMAITWKVKIVNLWSIPDKNQGIRGFRNLLGYRKF